MADPTGAVANPAKHHHGITKAKIVGGESLYPGAYAGVVIGEGEVQNLADEPNALPVGVVQGLENGGGNGLTADYLGLNANDESDPGVTVRGHVILTDRSVVGVASYEDRFKPVFATDGQTLTIVRPTADAIPMGLVWDKGRDDVTTTCDVFAFDAFDSWLYSTLGGNQINMDLAAGPLPGAAGYMIGSASTGIIMKGHGRILGLHGAVSVVPTDDIKFSTVNLEINGTDVTGGVLSLDANVIQTGGEVVNASAITALNEFHDGDILAVELATPGTAITDGSFRIWAVVEFLPGA